MRELAWVFRPVGVTATPAQLRRGRVRVKNRQDFAGLAGLRATWEVAIDGVVVQHGRLDLPDIAPGRAADVPVPFSPVDLGPGQEAHLTVRFVTRRATAWAPAGHEVAWDQVALPWKASRRQPAAGPLEAEPLVDASTGTLLDLQVGDRSLLAAPLELLLWRAPVDNDGLKLRPLEARMPLHRWRALGLDHLEQHCTGIDVRGDRVRSSHELRCAGGALHYRSDLRLDAGGVEGRFELEVPEAVADLPRIGHTFEVPPSLERVRWLGLGPHESYPDRRSSAVVGRFEAGADELPYLMPQSFGLRCGVRWWAVEELRRGGLGLLVVAGDPGELACSATYHTEADLEAARDLTDLVHRPGIVVHVDVAHRGLGTASCGPDTLPRYRIPAGIHRWSWRLLPYVVGRHDPARLARGAR
jgi:beta-galactosidase